MLWDDDYFYVAADMEDPDCWGTLTKRDSVIADRIRISRSSSAQTAMP